MTKQMTPLRRRMIEDMTIRNMSPSLPSNPTASTTINRRSLHQSSNRQPVHAAAVA
jgi:hypothetical protein